MIIVVVDALRADYLGSYGFKGGSSSFIDRFASESVQFDRCLSPAPWTKPAVASLFTSLHPETHGLIYPTMADNKPVFNNPLPPAAVTMAEIFKSNGYRTVAFNSNAWLAPESGLMRGFDETHFADRLLIPDMVNAWVSTAATAAPLFLYVHFLDVHGHYMFDATDFDQMKAQLMRQPGANDSFDNTNLVWYMKVTFNDNEKEKSVLNWRAAYAGAVKRFDTIFEKFRESLDAVGLLDNSIVIFTSDHGENLLQHRFLEHGDTLFIEELHVPLLVRFPNKRMAGRRIEDTVSLVDLLPTLSDLCHLKARSATWQGHSLLPVVRGEGRSGRTVYSAGVKEHPEVASAFSGNYHLISPGDGRSPLLFNILDDPFERTDIAAREPAITSRLLADLKRHVELQRKLKIIGSDVAPMSEEMKEQLRSLGYLQ